MIIYLYTNKKNGKKYVGQTNEEKRRLQEHVRKNVTVFDRAVTKYGIESFDYKVIDSAKTQEEANEKEMFWIKKLNSKAPNGYNMTDGGETSSGYHHTYEARKKMSLTKKSTMYGVGKNNNFYGKHHTAETREKMRKAWTKERKEKTVKILMAHHHTQNVRNKTTGKEFASIKEAADFYNLKATHISRVLKGKRKTTGGFEWERI